MKPLDPLLTLIATEARVRPPHVFHVFHAMREMGASFNVTAFAAFCQLEPKHIEAIISRLDHHGATAKRVRSAPSVKGERLEDGFTMPADWLLWAQAQKGWAREIVETEAASFIDYWHSKPGKEGCKTNWLATWRNWVRNSRTATGDFNPNAPVLTGEDRRAALEKSAALLERMGRTTEAKEIRDKIGSAHD